jgi:APA family basic amino acid/polyamine antiporter
MLTVLGIFFLRKNTNTSDHFKTPLYPIPPLIFIVCTSWMIYYVAVEEIKIILYALATMIPGYILFLLATKRNAEK